MSGIEVLKTTVNCKKVTHLLDICQISLASVPVYKNLLVWNVPFENGSMDWHW